MKNVCCHLFLFHKHIPFAPALPSCVVAHPEPCGIIDARVDDLIAVSLMNSRWHRLGGAALLALCVIGRPVDEKEPMSWDDLFSINKLLSEGSLFETK